MKKSTAKKSLPPTENEPRTLSPARRRTFTLLLLIVPFLFLGLVEIGLRAFQYGGELDLVVKRTIGTRELYSINRSVGRRYFAQAGTTIPEPADDKFEITKQKNTKRIFCLGESTMAGFPYEFHATAPGFLRDRLQAIFPQNNIEVINVGLSAVSSYIVLDFLDELTDYQPDLFIVYVGHNEFYGAYGVGSAVAVSGGPWMTRLTLTLLKFKTFLLMRDLYSSLLRWLSSSEKKPDGTMMGQMAADKTILLNSLLYNEAKEIYHDNLSRMITTAQSRHIPILFSSLVSSLKDQPPFVAVFDERTSGPVKAEWQRLVLEGDYALAHGQPRTAVVKFDSACARDTVNALAFFKLGSALYALREFDIAKAAFTKAKDRDALRFRATEEFKDVLVRTCDEFRVPLARVDSAFDAHSPHGIQGEELILEHLHPNIEGYFLMAKVFAGKMSEDNLLAPHQEWQKESQPPDDELFELSTVSDFDSTVGKLKVEFLKRRWPFTSVETPFAYTPSNTIEKVAYKYVLNKIGWSDARYLLAKSYANNKQFDLARKECLAVSKVIPFSYNPLLRIADYYRMEGKREESKIAYLRCIAVEENPYAHIKLGLTFLEDEQPAEAVKELNKALNVNATFAEKLTPEAASAARYLFGVAYAKLGKFSDAKEQLNIALAINSNNADARDLLTQIDNVKR